MSLLEGVYLPVITPFQDYEIDFVSYRRLIDYYLGFDISGIIPLGTTGEAPVLSESEYYRVIERTLEYVDGRVPVFAGLCSNNTHEAVKKAMCLRDYPLAGLLVTSPYYSRPSQEGLYTHFLRLSEAGAADIIIYNIPYRTGRNMENETVLRLAEMGNIIGIKDSCGNIAQSQELLMNRPEGFSVLTGEDSLYFFNLTHGGQGGILASAHWNTGAFVRIRELLADGGWQEAGRIWRGLHRIIPLLFEEPNPGPIKYLLHGSRLIASPELREPLTEISERLKGELDKAASVSRE